MSLRADRAALLTLLRHGGRAHQTYAELLEQEGGARALLERELLVAPEELARAERDIAAWEALGIRLVSVLEPDYPENLKAVHDRPPVLFVAGALQPGDVRSVAVIGSRTASERGIAAATAIATHLSDRGFTVVSGLAAGIDTAAHTATLARGGRTVAVIGTGLKHAYPPQNAPLQRQIAARGAVVSQFWPDAPPTRRSFPMRNAVMSGMTLATVIVEASERSGARIQARLALAQGRPVFLLEAVLQQPWARELASRPGTHVVSGPQQIGATVERLTGARALTA